MEKYLCLHRTHTHTRTHAVIPHIACAPSQLANVPFTHTHTYIQEQLLCGCRWLVHACCHTLHETAYCMYAMPIIDYNHITSARDQRSCARCGRFRKSAKARANDRMHSRVSREGSHIGIARATDNEQKAKQTMYPTPASLSFAAYTHKPHNQNPPDQPPRTAQTPRDRYALAYIYIYICV